MALVPSQVILSTDEMGRIAPPIFTSVGRGGANAPGDVFVIQSLLNDRLPKPHAPIPVNGVADVGTTLAIETYQAAILQMMPPSGRVDPGQPHLLCARRQAAGRQRCRPRRSAISARSRRTWPTPPSPRARSGLCPPRSPSAQWAVESAWGASMPPGSNNPFGIKAAGGQPAVESLTREVDRRRERDHQPPASGIRLAVAGIRRARPAAGDRRTVTRTPWTQATTPTRSPMR